MHRQREARRPAGDQGRRAAANPILILAGETGVAPGVATRLLPLAGRGVADPDVPGCPRATGRAGGGRSRSAGW